MSMYIVPRYDRIFTRMIDLHSHSTASDGSFSPSQLIDEAKRRNLSLLALTDHDTTAGLAEAHTRSQELGIQFIPGVEIEIAWEPGEFHLLGLGLTKLNDEFQEALANLARMREDRNLKILDQMKELGVEADYGEIQKLAEGKVVGRPHFATLLVQRGIVKNRQQAFSRYLAKGKPFYAPKGALELSEALRLIKATGAVAILAHPLSLFVSWGKLPQVVEELKSQGLDGLEAWHPTAKVRSCQRLELLGKSLGLLVTAGSDFHGASRPDRRLGRTAGDREIEARYAEGIPGFSAESTS